jgi:hypothetical protein
VFKKILRKKDARLGRRCVRLFPFPFSRVRFYSEGILGEQVRAWTTSQAEGFASHYENSYRRNFVVESS